VRDIDKKAATPLFTKESDMRKIITTYEPAGELVTGTIGA